MFQELKICSTAPWPYMYNRAMSACTCLSVLFIFITFYYNHNFPLGRSSYVRTIWPIFYNVKLLLSKLLRTAYILTQYFRDKNTRCIDDVYVLVWITVKSTHLSISQRHTHLKHYTKSQDNYRCWSYTFVYIKYFMVGYTYYFWVKCLWVHSDCFGLYRFGRKRLTTLLTNQLNLSMLYS